MTTYFLEDFCERIETVKALIRKDSRANHLLMHSVLIGHKPDSRECFYLIRVLTHMNGFLDSIGPRLENGDFVGGLPW